MKVHQLLKELNALNPDDDLCVLYWEKSAFDYSEDDEFVLTKEAWAKVVEEFDDMDFISIGEWISDAVIEHTEVNQ